MPCEILILDALQRSALAVTRSLGRLADVRVTTADAASETLAGSSRFSSARLQSPCSTKEPATYLDWMENLLRENTFDLVIPVTEVTSQLLLMNQHRFVNLRLPFANYETVMSLADKGRLVELAKGKGIPCPLSWHFSSITEVNVDELEFPLVLKPCLSKIFVGDSWISTQVRVINSKQDLMEAFRCSPYLQSSPFMLQQFIPGHGAGVFCLYSRGRPKIFFSHRRLREKPPQGGVSVLSESMAVDPVLKEYARTVLDAVQWHGVAMVEFRIDPAGNAYLMEVNTRFWGSLQLAIDSGVDFPKLLWEAERVNSESEFSQVSRTNYRVGQRLRWLLGDVDSLYLFLKSDYSNAQKLKRVLQFFTPCLWRCRHEINRWDDLRPAWFELVGYLKQISRR